MKNLALWLSATAPSVFIKEHNAWTIPVIQSIHILGIALVMGTVLMIDLSILGWASRDQTAGETARRFGPWLTGSLCLMLVSGGLMVIGQPTRELMSLSFRLKMGLVAAGAVIAFLMVRALSKRGLAAVDRTPGAKALAIATFVGWVCIIVLGRLIAYDHVWGSWSPAG